MTDNNLIWQKTKIGDKKNKIIFYFIEKCYANYKMTISTIEIEKIEGKYQLKIYKHNNNNVEIKKKLLFDVKEQAEDFADNWIKSYPKG